MTGAAAWWEGTARSIGLIGGTLLMLAAVFRTVPPFKQIARYVWRRLVAVPLHESFKRAVKEANGETIQFEVRRAANKAIGRAVPGAVQRSFDEKVAPRLDEFRDALTEHMRVEEEVTARETAFRQEVLDRLAANQRATYEIEGRVESIEQQVVLRTESIEQRIAEQRVDQLEGHVTLTPKMTESPADQPPTEGTG